MDLPSSRAVFNFVVHQGESFLIRLSHMVAAFLSSLCAAVLRIIVTGVVFTICMMAMLHYFGVPIPGPSDVLNKVEAVGRLARILS